MKNKKRYIVGVLLSALLLTIIPINSYAATSLTTAAINYKPRTKAETIAYIYGRISQLIEMKKAMERSGGVNNPSLFNYAVAETRDSIDETSSTAILRGEVTLYGDAQIYVWFEYGQDEDFLDLKTSSKTVGSVYDRAVRMQVSNLEDDEKYYYRIVSLDKNDNVQYGEIYEFRTDEIDE